MRMENGSPRAGKDVTCFRSIDALVYPTQTCKDEMLAPFRYRGHALPFAIRAKFHASGNVDFTLVKAQNRKLSFESIKSHGQLRTIFNLTRWRLRNTRAVCRLSRCSLPLCPLQKRFCAWSDVRLGILREAYRKFPVKILFS